MSGEEEEIVDNAKTPEAKAVREAEIAERLRSIDAKVTGGETLAKLMADPDVRALLESKQAGKTVRVVIGDEAQEDDEEDDVDLDSLSNKELTKHLLKHITNAVSQTVEKRIAEVESQVGGLFGHIQNTEAAEIKKNIERLREQFPDFDDLRETMTEINRTSPGLSVDELYVLAKVRRGGLEGLRGGLSSEKPTRSTARPPSKVQRKIPLPFGRRGFSALLQEALEKQEHRVSNEDEVELEE